MSNHEKSFEDKNYDEFTEEEKKAYKDKYKNPDLALKIFNITFILFLIVYFSIYLGCKNEQGLSRYRVEMNELNAKNAAHKVAEQKLKDAIEITKIEETDKTIGTNIDETTKN